MGKLVLIFVMVLLGAVTANAGPMDPKTIVVSGFAQEAVRPDYATVSVGVISVEKTTSQALSANSMLMHKVLEAIKAEGIADKDIQTTNFGIRAVHPPRKGEAYGEDEMITLGYRVSNTVTVVMPDMKRIGAVIDAATRAGANMSGEVSFDFKNRQAMEAKLLADAVRDARHNAEIMAAAESAKVGKLIAVSNTAPVGPTWNDKASSSILGRLPDRDVQLESVVIVEGVVPVSAQVMAIYALE